MSGSAGTSLPVAAGASLPAAAGSTTEYRVLAQMDDPVLPLHKIIVRIMHAKKIASTVKGPSITR